LAANTPTTSTTELTPSEPTTPQGQYEMGDNYFYGRNGVNRDNQQAVVWYRRAAKQGYAEAEFTLGQVYENGWGANQDLALAKRWYRDAARQGIEAADAALKRLEGENTQSAPSALSMPNESTAPTAAQTEYIRGNDYLYGRNGVSQDYQQAILWYQKAANQGNAKAQVQLAWFYESGLGVEKDNAQARLWYQRAADQGNLFAQTALTRLQASADTSTPTAGSGGPLVGECDRSDNSVDTTIPVCAAALAAKRAAEQGDAEAQTQLAWLYESGLGVGKDYARARLWYQRAADQGNQFAKTALTRLLAQ
jgi:TPR repeat protein